MSRHRFGAPGICLLLLGAGPAVLALERIELTLGRLEGEGWQAEGAVASMTLGEKPGVTISLDNLSVPPPLDLVRGLRLDCP